MPLKPSTLSWKNQEIPAFILGSVQLGTLYGIANTVGQPSPTESFAILNRAIASGYSWIDTAQAYGESEAILGDFAQKNPTTLTFISKLHPTLDPTDSAAIYRAIQASTRTLGGPIWSMMLHREEWLDYWDKGLREGLLRAQKEKLIQHIGVSVYSPQAIALVLKIPEIDCIQLPFNAWDPTLIDSNWLEKIKDHGKIGFLRSVYLQGVLLMSEQRIKEKLPHALSIARAWIRICAEWQCTPQQLAIRYAKHWGMPLVIGVETLTQLDETVGLIQAPPLSGDNCLQIQHALHPLSNPNIVNPSKWGLK